MKYCGSNFDTSAGMFSLKQYVENDDSSYVTYHIIIHNTIYYIIYNIIYNT